MNRYSPQIKLEFMTKEIQKDLSIKKLIVIGCGGIGSPLAELLIRGGFQNLILVDNDIIEQTNLQRQMFFENEIGKSKAKTLKNHLLKINKNANIEAYQDRVSLSNIDNFSNNVDLIIDATDNFESRIMINFYCEQNNKTWLYNGAVKTQAISCIFKGKDKLFQKVFPKEIKNQTANTIGILTSTTFISASLAYNQIMKYFLKTEENKLIKIDLWTNKIHEINIK